jgi:FkbM family methyltransferase
MYFITPNRVKLATDLYHGIFVQMFCLKLYEFPSIWKHNNYVVFDVGMNRGYSSLWFAKDKKCKNVFGFEVDNDTYKFALKNFKLNPKISKKIIGYDFGLSNRNDDNYELMYIPGEDSVTTIDKKFASDYYSDSRKKRCQTKPAVLRKASEIIDEIITEKAIKAEIILKIDVEGAEYDILKDLNQKGVLKKFSLILGECHDGMKKLEKYLNDFKLVDSTKITEKLYNFCYIRKDCLPITKF